MLCSCCNYFIIFPFPVTKLQQAATIAYFAAPRGLQIAAPATQCRGVESGREREGGEEKGSSENFCTSCRTHTHTHSERQEGGNANAWKNFATAVFMCVCVCCWGLHATCTSVDKNILIYFTFDCSASSSSSADQAN